MDRSHKKFENIIWMHNSKYQCHMAACCTYHQLTSPNCWTGAVQKSLSLNKKYWRIFWKMCRRKGQQAEKDKAERVTGLGRRTREEIAQWNQMTALDSRQGGDIRHPWPLFGDSNRNLHPEGWPILFCGPTQELVLATANTGKKLGEVFEKMLVNGPEG